MKINKKIILIATITIAAILLFGMPGFSIGPYLYFSLLIIVGYIIIDAISKFANRMVDALGKRQAVGNVEINTKIDLMMQRMETIENKVDEINKILEKVSE